MSMKIQKRLAADILKCGENRIRFDPERLDDIRDAITRAEVKALIKDGAIFAEQAKGQQRIRVKEKRGPGRKKGAKHAVISRKRRWIMRVRSQRRYLMGLRAAGRLKEGAYRKVYLQIKAGRFKSIADLKAYLTENQLLKHAIS